MERGRARGWRIEGHESVGWQWRAYGREGAEWGLERDEAEAERKAVEAFERLEGVKVGAVGEAGYVAP